MVAEGSRFDARDLLRFRPPGSKHFFQKCDVLTLGASGIRIASVCVVEPPLTPHSGPKNMSGGVTSSQVRAICDSFPKYEDLNIGIISTPR